MQHPNYFIADLPAEATLTEKVIVEACQTLRRNRQQYLMSRSVQSIIGTLAEVAEQWLKKDFPPKRWILDSAPEGSGFSKETLETGLDDFFRELTVDNLQKLIIQDLGQVHRLAEITSDDMELEGDRASMARGPELLVHVTAGSLPNPTLMSMVLGLLTRSAQFVKLASGAGLVPRMFAHSLYQLEPKLASCIELAEWPGGSDELESALFAEADCVTATGADETLEFIRQRTPRHVRFLGYGHKVSFAYVTREMMAPGRLRELAKLAARDVSAWDQLGCLSPHVIYAETGGQSSPEELGELLSQELAEVEKSQPRGAISPDDAAAVSTRRHFYQVRAAHSLGARLWASEESTAWTVVFEEDSKFQHSCLNRFVYVKAVSDVDEAIRSVDSVRGQVSTVGLAAVESKTLPVAHRFARWGVSRICPLGQMQRPPLLWRHDGRPALGDLVAWTGLEFGESLRA